MIVISGPSGVGKDTIINELRRRPVGQTFHYVVTCTTVDGVVTCTSCNTIVASTTRNAS